MRKLLIAAVVMATSFSSSASIVCNFTFEKGNGFEFAQNSSLDKFKAEVDRKVPDIENRWIVGDHDLVKSLDKSDLRYRPYAVDFESSYKDWFYDPKGEMNLEYSKFFSRRAKFQDEPFLRFQERSKEAPYTNVWARYYRATVDNCETVYLRIQEDDRRVSKYFDMQDDRVSGDINFEWEESEYNIRFVSPFHKLDTWVGKKIYVVPGADRTKWVNAKKVDTYEKAVVPNHSVLTVLGLVRGAFDLDGQFLSPYMIKVEDEHGEIRLIPWVPEKIVFQDPFSNKSIRDKFKAAIRKGEIVFGMNQSEVQLSWGYPNLERYYDISLNEVGAETVEDETYRKDGLLKGYRVLPALVKTSDKMTAWHYPDLLPKKHFLVFDRKGILTEENQTYGLKNAEVQKVYNAKH